jgi:hypothetical protein
MPMQPRRGTDDEFWQRLVLPEEERRWIRDWEGGYRWFQSPNVIQIERFRGRDEMAQIRGRRLRK